MVMGRLNILRTGMIIECSVSVGIKGFLSAIVEPVSRESFED